MAKLTPKRLNLSAGEQEQLQQLTNRHNTPQPIALQAKIILMASEGQNHREIARKLDINRQTARLWRNRWLETEGKELSIVQRLQDSERVGAPGKFSMEQVIDQIQEQKLILLFMFAEQLKLTLMLKNGIGLWTA